MFEKCEQATSNPDILLQNNALKSSYDNSYHQYYNRHTYNSSQQNQIQNEMKNFDHELKFFLKNNQQIVQNSNSGSNQKVSLLKIFYEIFKFF